MKRSTQTMHFEFDNKSGILTIKPVESFKGPETEEQAKENVDKVNEFWKDSLKGMLAYLPQHYINVQATAYYKQNAPKVPLALIGDSFFKKMIGNFLLSLGSSTRPTKLFTTLKEADQWLNDQVAGIEINKAG